ncbi:MAG: nucleotidyltransferase family protein [Bacteroidetes bacterium]|nr:nucleotidyltransferase family protein [Fibrella sp.]
MIQQALVSQYLNTQPVKRAYLFGSRARGEATPLSDVDILVELETAVTLFDFVRMQLQLEDLLQVPVDLVSANGLSSFIQPNVDRDKILIYEKGD